MTRLRRRALAAAATLPLALVLLVPGARGDRIHLESGGRIDTESWWVEGDWLMYEGPDGTVGLPRSAVVRIESGERSLSRPAGKGQDRSAARPARAPSASSADPARLRELVGKGNAALEGRDFELASAYYLEAVGEEPELYAARVGYAVSEIAMGRDGLALSVILDGIALDPDRPELLELLGDLRYRDERTDEALRSWTRAFELSPSDRLREKILKAEREFHASRDYEFAASPHFNVRFDGEVDIELAAAVMDHLEEQYWSLTEEYRHSPAQPITVQLYPRREFREVTRSPEWVGGLYDGKIRVPLGGLERLHRGARSVLKHELTHAVIHSKTRGNCPRWLHEGLAQRSEGKRLNAEQRRQVAGRLGAADPSTWESSGFSYPIALGLVEHLESRQGFDAIVYLLQFLGDGRDLDDALLQVYGVDYAGICRDWARSLQVERNR